MNFFIFFGMPIISSMRCSKIAETLSNADLISISTPQTLLPFTFADKTFNMSVANAEVHDLPLRNPN